MALCSDRSITDQAKTRRGSGCHEQVGMESGYSVTTSTNTAATRTDPSSSAVISIGAYAGLRGLRRILVCRHVPSSAVPSGPG